LNFNPVGDPVLISSVVFVLSLFNPVGDPVLISPVVFVLTLL
jgi:hypothetical protein